MASESKNKSHLKIDKELLSEIESLIESRSDALLRNILADLYDYDIAVLIDTLRDDNDAIYLFSLLSQETAGEIILELGDERRDAILENLSEGKLSNLLVEMDSDDAADLVADLDEDEQHKVLQSLDTVGKEDSDELRELLKYDENTAGGIMAKEFIVAHVNDSVSETIKVIQEKGDEIDQFYNMWIVDDHNHLKGIISLRRLIISMKDPNQKMSEVMNPDVISVDANMDQEEVAKIFMNYDLVSVPVVDSDERVIGRITIDDVMDVVEEEYTEDVAKMTGTDAEELEKKSSLQIARMRLPWLMIALGVEMIAVIVIKAHDKMLGEIILLAAFMPIINAISGNSGLQSAAIVVRALDTGYITLAQWWVPFFRQIKTNLIIGLVIGVLVGIIGYLMSSSPQNLKFGFTVGISMFTSINIAGFAGTAIPMLSKKFGFDPAVSSGPFATAFQDVIGVTIFLTLAQFLLTTL
ncbi:MAG: magnesium transporter [Ignavibacteriae bacterium]|nr:magnesium transporter [Ignavibacteriota bacterium]